MSDPYLGEVKLLSSQRISRGWLQCAGQLLAIRQDQALFALIGTTYGGDGKDTFAVPDLRGRAPLGAYGATRVAPYGLGFAAGAEQAALTVGNIPLHNHSVQVSSSAGTVSSVANGIYAAVMSPSDHALYSPMSAPPVAIDPSSVNAASASAPHNNMQPYVAMCYCIATQGIFPPRPS